MLATWPWLAFLAKAMVKRCSLTWRWQLEKQQGWHTSAEQRSGEVVIKDSCSDAIKKLTKLNRVGWIIYIFFYKKILKKNVKGIYLIFSCSLNSLNLNHCYLFCFFRVGKIGGFRICHNYFIAAQKAPKSNYLNTVLFNFYNFYLFWNCLHWVNATNQVLVDHKKGKQCPYYSKTKIHRLHWLSAKK